MEILNGTVERVTYYNEENGYSVLRLASDDSSAKGKSRDGFVTATGNLPEISVGEALTLKGEWKKHPKHGTQFIINTCERVLPTSLYGLQKYLGSGLLVGIGEKLAQRIVDTFSEDTIRIIEEEPKKLRSVQDIGKKRAKAIVKAWDEHKHIKNIMVFLHSYDVSSNLAFKIYKEYEDESINVLKDDPYQLAQTIRGVGFKTADRIALKMGLPHDHPSRIAAAILHTLEGLVSEGHSFSPSSKLISNTQEMLNIPVELIQEQLNVLIKQELVIEDTSLLTEDGVEAGAPIYLPPYYHAESQSAAKLSALNTELNSKLADIPPAFLSFEDTISDEQQDAIRKSIGSRVSILTGGPGTGKTTALKGLIEALNLNKKKYALCSPTGRAAKRLAEATGQPASTIHRLLRYSPRDGFQFNQEQPLKLDMVIIDEASMLDILLLYHLLMAIQSGTHLLFVGDIDQLPSVGAGDVMRDMIQSNQFQVTRLTKIFRQAEGSQIIRNAHLINLGQQPEFPDGGTDFFKFPARTPEEALNWVVDLMTKRIPEKFGCDPLKDIQVLAPMYRGTAGINTLNQVLQDTLNPPQALKPEIRKKQTLLRKGDKVMQIRNNYDKDVFNGDIGTLVDVSSVDKRFWVEIDGRRIEYEWSETDQVTLAYAISIHKSQGSEFPVVIMPLLTQHYLMLQRNLFYTGITRAKKICVLVTNQKALAIAVKNNQVAHRYSGLKLRLV